MMETQNYWEDSSSHSMQVKYESLDGRSCKDEIYRMGLGAGYCEGNLNFATASEDDEVYTKKKVSRQDPMSHRIIEKRRRDRMNNCLADLSRLIPAEYLKKGRGRVEKTEIIEMAIRHMKYLQGLRQDSKHHAPVSSVHHHAEDSVDSVTHQSPSSGSASAAEHYRLGYQECLSETMHFLVEVEGFFARDALCVQLISHLQQHCDKILASSDRLGFPHPVDLATGSLCANGGVSFGNGNAGIPTMCPNGPGGLLNGHIGNLNGTGTGNTNNNNNNNNNNTSSQNLNGSAPGPLQGHAGLLHSGSTSSSDRCSSSGVSSYDPSESRASGQRPLIAPPNLTSDDSNHSSHSQGSGSLPPVQPRHHHLHHHHHHQDHQDAMLGQPRQRPSTYKFKNSIKQRFSADQRIKSSPSPPGVHETSPARNGHQTPQQQQQQHSTQQQQQGVPIFALHDNGGFYIPLTVEASLLRPQLGCASPDLGPETVLHPVTISVNFNHTTPGALWSHPSPPHQVQ